MTVFAVTFENLLSVGVAALVAGVGVTAVFSFAVLGASRSAEARRERRASAGWTALAVAGGLGVIVAVVAGIYAVAAL